MLPAVAEIVFIADRDANREREIAQPNGAFVDDVLSVFRIGFAVAFAAQGEFMQVAILPFHHGLNNTVQLLEREAFGHLDTPPDARLDIFERHAKLQSIIEPFRWHTAAHTKLRRRQQFLARGIAHRARTEQAAFDCGGRE